MNTLFLTYADKTDTSTNAYRLRRRITAYDDISIVGEHRVTITKNQTPYYIQAFPKSTHLPSSIKRSLDTAELPRSFAEADREINDYFINDKTIFAMPCDSLDAWGYRGDGSTTVGHTPLASLKLFGKVYHSKDHRSIVTPVNQYGRMVIGGLPSFDIVSSGCGVDFWFRADGDIPDGTVLLHYTSKDGYGPNGTDWTDGPDSLPFILVQLQYVNKTTLRLLYKQKGAAYGSTILTSQTFTVSDLTKWSRLLIVYGQANNNKLFITQDGVIVLDNISVSDTAIAALWYIHYGTCESKPGHEGFFQFYAFRIRTGVTGKPDVPPIPDPDPGPPTPTPTPMSLPSGSTPELPTTESDYFLYVDEDLSLGDAITSYMSIGGLPCIEYSDGTVAATGEYVIPAKLIDPGLLGSITPVEVDDAPGLVGSYATSAIELASYTIDPIGTNSVATYPTPSGQIGGVSPMQITTNLSSRVSLNITVSLTPSVKIPDLHHWRFVYYLGKKSVSPSAQDVYAAPKTVTYGVLSKTVTPISIPIPMYSFGAAVDMLKCVVIAEDVTNRTLYTSYPSYIEIIEDEFTKEELLSRPILAICNGSSTRHLLNYALENSWAEFTGGYVNTGHRFNKNMTGSMVLDVIYRVQTRAPGTVYPSTAPVNILGMTLIQPSGYDTYRLSIDHVFDYNQVHITVGSSTYGTGSTTPLIYTFPYLSKVPSGPQLDQDTDWARVTLVIDKRINRMRVLIDGNVVATVKYSGYIPWLNELHLGAATEVWYSGELPGFYPETSPINSDAKFLLRNFRIWEDNVLAMDLRPVNPQIDFRFHANPGLGLPALWDTVSRSYFYIKHGPLIKIAPGFILDSEGTAAHRLVATLPSKPAYHSYPDGSDIQSSIIKSVHHANYADNIPKYKLGFNTPPAGAGFSPSSLSSVISPPVLEEAAILPIMSTNTPYPQEYFPAITTRYGKSISRTPTLPLSVNPEAFYRKFMYDYLQLVRTKIVQGYLSDRYHLADYTGVYYGSMPPLESFMTYNEEGVTAAHIHSKSMYTFLTDTTEHGSQGEPLWQILAHRYLLSVTFQVLKGAGTILHLGILRLFVDKDLNVCIEMGRISGTASDVHTKLQTFKINRTVNRGPVDLTSNTGGSMHTVTIYSHGGRLQVFFDGHYCDLFEYMATDRDEVLYSRTDLLKWTLGGSASITTDSGYEALISNIILLDLRRWAREQCLIEPELAVYPHKIFGPQTRRGSTSKAPTILPPTYYFPYSSYEYHVRSAFRGNTTTDLISGKELPEFPGTMHIKDGVFVSKGDGSVVPILPIESSVGITIEFWAKTATLPGVIFAASDVDGSPFTLYVTENRSLGIVYRTSTGIKSSEVSIYGTRNFIKMANEWHHYAICYKPDAAPNQSILVVYIDGCRTPLELHDVPQPRNYHIGVNKRTHITTDVEYPVGLSVDLEQAFMVYTATYKYDVGNFNNFFTMEHAGRHDVYVEYYDTVQHPRPTLTYSNDLPPNPNKIPAYFPIYNSPLLAVKGDSTKELIRSLPIQSIMGNVVLNEESGALYFDRNTKVLIDTGAPLTSLSGSITIECWVRSEIEKDGDGQDNNYCIFFFTLDDNDSKKITANTSINGADGALAKTNLMYEYRAGLASVPNPYVSAAYQIPPKWFHVAICMSPTEVTYFFNGTIVKRMAVANGIRAFNKFYLGCKGNQSVYYHQFKGYIGNLVVSDTCRYAEDFSAKLAPYLT